MRIIARLPSESESGIHHITLTESALHYVEHQTSDDVRLARSDTCHICLQIVSSDAAIHFHCRQPYHQGCLNQWAKMKADGMDRKFRDHSSPPIYDTSDLHVTCPTCRKVIGLVVGKNSRSTLAAISYATDYRYASQSRYGTDKGSRHRFDGLVYILPPIPNWNTVRCFDVLMGMLWDRIAIMVPQSGTQLLDMMKIFPSQGICMVPGEMLHWTAVAAVVKVRSQRDRKNLILEPLNRYVLAAETGMQSAWFDLLWLRNEETVERGMVQPIVVAVIPREERFAMILNTVAVGLHRIGGLSEIGESET